MLVIYSGKERWTEPLQWIDYLALPKNPAAELLELEMNFGYQLVNLSRLSAGEIRGDIAGRLTLGLMKAAAEDRVLEWLKRAVPLLKMLRKKEVTGMFEALLRYLLAVDTSVSRENVLSTLEDSNTPELTQQAMSIADQLIAEGKVLGGEEALRKERTENIRAYQTFLRMPQSSDAELQIKSNVELKQLATELLTRFGKA